MVLFIIGNGFDLSLGMNTSFAYMKKKFIEKNLNDSKSEKSQFFQSFKDDHQLWSDFEMGIAKYANKLKTKEDMEKFSDFIEEFVSFLTEELIKENQKFPVQNFYDKQRMIVNSVNDLLSNYKGKEFINFMTFNYTDKVNHFASTLVGTNYFTVSSNVIHVHNDLDKGIIVGIDNIQQIDSINVFDDNYKDRLKLLFTKSAVAKNDIKMSYQAALDLVRACTRFVIIGCSLGPSDQTWINEISKRFRELKDRDSLIFYNHVEEKSSISTVRKNISVELEIKNQLLTKFGLELNDENREKIRVINQDNIFDSSKIKNESTKITTFSTAALY